MNALTYLSKTEKTDLRPDFVAGHSLGEYNALFAAGVFDFITGLKISTKKRANYGQSNRGRYGGSYWYATG